MANKKNTMVSQKEFQDHCKANSLTDKKLDQLMPLVDLIPTLELISEAQKVQTFMAKRLARAIGIWAGVAAILAGSITAIYYTLKLGGWK